MNVFFSFESKPGKPSQERLRSPDFNVVRELIISSNENDL